METTPLIAIRPVKLTDRGEQLPTLASTLLDADTGARRNNSPLHEAALDGRLANLKP